MLEPVSWKKKELNPNENVSIFITKRKSSPAVFASSSFLPPPPSSSLAGTYLFKEHKGSY